MVICINFLMNENVVMAKEKVINVQYIHKLISNNIKRLRSLQNISQLTLATSVGLTHNFINDIENCKKGISANTLAKLSVALGVEPYQLFLPEGMSNNEIMVYLKDINNSFYKVVDDLTQQYLAKSLRKTPEDEEK